MRATSERDITQGCLAQSIWDLAWPTITSHLPFISPPLYDAIAAQTTPECTFPGGKGA